MIDEANKATTKVITITHGNGSTQTMEVPIDFDQSTLISISQEQIDLHLASEQAKEAQQYLDSTDWYLVRKLDVGADIPVEVANKRQECRDLISAYREQTEQ